MMFNNISLENLKCFKLTKLKDLKAVNFIVGEPDTGKTIFLEEFSRKWKDDSMYIDAARTASRKRNKSDKIKIGGYEHIHSSIVNALLAQKYKFIMIDEIENGIHFSKIDLVLSTILNAQDVQFFITTHSLEVLQHLAGLMEERDQDEDKVAVISFYRDKENEIQSVTYDKERFVFAMNVGNEIRQ